MKRNLILGVLAILVLILGAASYAHADTATVYGVGGTASDTVSVTATINAMLVLTVTTPSASQTVDFGAVNPGDTTASQLVTLTVRSNRTYNITKVITGGAAMGLSTSLLDSANNARTAGQLYTDNYWLANVPWTSSPGAYVATVQYTVIQN